MSYIACSNCGTDKLDNSISTGCQCFCQICSSKLYYQYIGMNLIQIVPDSNDNTLPLKTIINLSQNIRPNSCFYPINTKLDLKNINNKSLEDKSPLPIYEAVSPKGSPLESPSPTYIPTSPSYMLSSDYEYLSDESCSHTYPNDTSLNHNSLQNSSPKSPNNYSSNEILISNKNSNNQQDKILTLMESSTYLQSKRKQKLCDVCYREFFGPSCTNCKKKKKKYATRMLQGNFNIKNK